MIEALPVDSCVRFKECFKESKEKKQRMKREEYGGNKKEGNIKEWLCFWVFKTNRKKDKKRYKKLMATNY